MKFKAVIMGVVLAVAGNAYGQSGDAILDLLIKKGIITQREANEVREQLDKDTAQTVELYNKTKVASWIDEMKWSGDLRLRGEYFDNKDQTTQIDRLRFRVRLRLGVEAKFWEWATIGVRIATGEKGGDTTNDEGDPVSTNQTLNRTFSKKPFRVDLAYVTLQPPGWNWIKVTGGKMEIPIWQPKFNSPMVYDFDVTPEGVAEQFEFAFGDKQRHRVFANLGQFPVRELNPDSNDVYLFDSQAGIEAKFGEDPKKPVLKVTAASGYYFLNSLDQTAQGDSPNRGNNATGPGGNYLADFNVLYGRGEVAWTVSDRPFLGTPAVLTFAGEYLKNVKGAYESVAAGDRTKGYTGQIAFGNAKKKHEWQIAYQYKYIEGNATWDAITDSDWGTGGTDRKGHVLKAAYNFQDWWQLGLTAFLTEKISTLATGSGGIAGDGSDLLRLQVDTVFKF